MEVEMARSGAVINLFELMATKVAAAIAASASSRSVSRLCQTSRRTGASETVRRTRPNSSPR
jgi:hypothetical protein